MRATICHPPGFFSEVELPSLFDQNLFVGSFGNAGFL